jgi:hypothetical protein
MTAIGASGFSINTLLGSTTGLAIGDAGKILPGTGVDGNRAGTSVPGGIESVLEYNGIYLNVRDWIDTYLVTIIGGLDDADVRDTREVNPGFHGETAFPAYYGGRTITLTGKIIAHTLAKLRDMQRGLRQAFSEIDHELPLIFRTPDPDLDMMIMCKKSQPIQMTEEQRTANHFERAFLITLRASNPRFLSVSEVYNSTKFADVSAFGIPDQVTTETFDSPGIFTQYNERGHGFVITGGKLTYDTSLPADNFVNLIAEPDFQEIDYQSHPTTIVVTNGILEIANSGGVLDNGKHGVLRNPVAASVISARWDVNGIAPGAYSAIGYMRSPFRSRQGRLMVEWLDASNNILGSQYTEITTTGLWQKLSIQGAIAPAGTAKSRWYLLVNFVDANEEHHIDKMLVVGGNVFPPEGYFDGSNSLADWTDEGNLIISGSTSKQPQYSILTTSRSYKNAMQVVKFTTPATLPTPRVGEIRLVMSYLNDDNYVYAYIGEKGVSGPPPSGRLYMGFKQVLNGVDDFTDAALGDFLLDPSTTYWFLAYLKDDVIHAEVTDLDPYTRDVSYTNIDHSTSSLFFLTPELKAIYNSLTPMQLVVMEKGARIPVEEWIYQPLEAPSGWAHKYPVSYIRYDTIWVRGGRIVPLGVKGPLLVRSDLPYNVENGRISAKIRHNGIPTDLNVTWGIAVKVLGAEDFIVGQMEYTATATPAIQVRLTRWNEGTPFGSSLGTAAVTPANFPANTDAWIAVVINGDQFTLEFWKTDPALGGAATHTTGAITLSGANKTKYGAGIKGQVGIIYDAPKAARAISIDDFKIEQQSFDDTAFLISNDGNFSAQPEIHIIGPMTNPVIVNESNGDWMSIPTTIPVDEEWIIDIEGRRMYRKSDDANRFRYLDANSDWLEIEPGTNYISLTATGMTATSQMDMRFHHTVM